MLMTKFFLIREKYGLSQYEVAKDLGIAQRTYATYDSGKTQKVPADFLKKFAYHYRVNEDWLMGNDTPWDQFERDDMQSIKAELSDRIPEVAERLRLPLTFIQAVFAGEIEGSKELWQTINNQFNPHDTNDLVDKMNLRNDVARLADEVARLTVQLTDRDATIRNQNDHIALLREKLARIKSLYPDIKL